MTHLGPSYHGLELPRWLAQCTQYALELPDRPEPCDAYMARVPYDTKLGPSTPLWPLARLGRPFMNGNVNAARTALLRGLTIPCSLRLGRGHAATVALACVGAMVSLAMRHVCDSHASSLRCGAYATAITSQATCVCPSPVACTRWSRQVPWTNGEANGLVTFHGQLVA